MENGLRQILLFFWELELSEKKSRFQKVVLRLNEGYIRSLLEDDPGGQWPSSKKWSISWDLSNEVLFFDVGHQITKLWQKNDFGRFSPPPKKKKKFFLIDSGGEQKY